MTIHILKVGDKAPGFELPTNTGKSVSLKSLKGKNIVLYFYPKDASPGCTIEARDFNVNIKKFKDHNCEIIGISRDSVESHCDFADKHKLKMLLASDETGEVCEKYGVLMERNLFFIKKYSIINRSTFLIDKFGVVRKTWYSVGALIGVFGHVKEVLHELEILDK